MRRFVIVRTFLPTLQVQTLRTPRFALVHGQLWRENQLLRLIVRLLQDFSPVGQELLLAILLATVLKTATALRKAYFRTLF